MIFFFTGSRRNHRTQIWKQKNKKTINTHFSIFAFDLKKYLWFVYRIQLNRDTRAFVHRFIGEREKNWWHIVDEHRERNKQIFDRNQTKMRGLLSSKHRHSLIYNGSESVLAAARAKSHSHLIDFCFLSPTTYRFIIILFFLHWMIDSRADTVDWNTCCLHSCSCTRTAGLSENAEPHPIILIAIIKSHLVREWSFQSGSHRRRNCFFFLPSDAITLFEYRFCCCCVFFSQFPEIYLHNT